MVLAEEAFGLRRVAVVADGDQLRLFLLCAQRAEFVYRERSPAVTYPLLREDCGTVFLSFQHYADYEV